MNEDEADDDKTKAAKLKLPFLLRLPVFCSGVVSNYPRT